MSERHLECDQLSFQILQGLRGVMFFSLCLIVRRTKRLEFPDDDPSFVDLCMFSQSFEFLQTVMLFMVRMSGLSCENTTKEVRVRVCREESVRGWAEAGIEGGLQREPTNERLGADTYLWAAFPLDAHGGYRLGN